MSETNENTLREQEARIRQLVTDALLKEVESTKRWQDIRFAPWALMATGLGAGAALLGAGAALFVGALAYLKSIGA